MARESRITFEQVATIADSLASQGSKPTSRAVREILGTGSMATILKHLQQWGGSQQRQSQVIDDTLDPAVLRAISNHIADKVQSATAAATAQLADQQAETETLIIENERQAAELEALTTAISTLQDQHNKQTGIVEQLTAEANRIVNELAAERQAAETARIALAKAELRLEAVPRIEAEIDRVRKELEAAQKQAAELHESAAVATAKLESSMLQRQESDTQIADLKTTLKQIQEQFAAEQDKNKNIAADHAATLAAQVKATHAAESRAIAAESTTAALNQQIIDLKTQITEFKSVKQNPAKTVKGETK